MSDEPEQLVEASLDRLIFAVFKVALPLAGAGMPGAAVSLWMDCMRMAFLFGEGNESTPYSVAARRIAEALNQLQDRGAGNLMGRVTTDIHRACARELRDRIAEGIDESEYRRLCTVMRDLCVRPDLLDAHIAAIKHVPKTDGDEDKTDEAWRGSP
jgi:hypothetical protein